MNKTSIGWSSCGYECYVLQSETGIQLLLSSTSSIKIVDFAVPADHRINLKESEKNDKYLDLARELKKLWNMKVTIVPIVIGALGT